MQSAVLAAPQSDPILPSSRRKHPPHWHFVGFFIFFFFISLASGRRIEIKWIISVEGAKIHIHTCICMCICALIPKLLLKYYSLKCLPIHLILPNEASDWSTFRTSSVGHNIHLRPNMRYVSSHTFIFKFFRSSAWLAVNPQSNCRWERPHNVGHVRFVLNISTRFNKLLT